MNQTEPPSNQKGFQWVEYRGKQQICYVKDFIEKYKKEQPQFFRSLDLPNLCDGVVSTKPANLGEITDYLYKKIVMHGALQSTNKIARRTGALRKDDSQKDHNYYDQDDPFIDDEVEQGNQNKNQMQLVYAQYDDFGCFEGSLADFINSDLYEHRLSILDNVGREPIPNSPKRKAVEDLPPAEYKSEKKANDKANDKANEKANEKSIDKTIDKIKKKVKKTQDKQTPSKTEANNGTITPPPKPQNSSDMKKQPVTFLMPNMPNMPSMTNQQPGVFFGPPQMQQMPQMPQMAQMPQIWPPFPGMYQMGPGFPPMMYQPPIQKRQSQVIQIDQD